MGGVLSCLVTEAACCVTTTSCRLCCRAFGGSCCGRSGKRITSSMATRISYAALFLLTSLTAFLLMNVNMTDISFSLPFIIAPSSAPSAPSAVSAVSVVSTPRDISASTGFPTATGLLSPWELYDTHYGLTDLPTLPNIPSLPHFPDIRKNITGLGWLKCPDGVSCYGPLAAYRVCLGLAFFHIFMAFVTYGASSSRGWQGGLQNGLWLPKLAVWTGASVGAFFIPDSFYTSVYYPVALIASVVFILIQLIFLVDFAHTWSETWVRRYEEAMSEQAVRGWAAALIGSSAFMAIVVMTLTVLMYVWFGQGSGCGVNNIWVSINLVFFVLTCVTSVLPKIQEGNPQSGLMPAVVVSLYATYLVFSALSNAPVTVLDDVGHTQSCNPLVTSQSTTQAVSLLLGSIFTFIAIAYSTTSTASQSGALMNVAAAIDNASDSEALLESGVPSAVDGDDDDDNDDDDTADDKYAPDDEKNGLSYSYSFFHFIFVIAILYVAMLLTNWEKVALVPPVPSDGGGGGGVTSLHIDGISGASDTVPVAPWSAHVPLPSLHEMDHGQWQKPILEKGKNEQEPGPVFWTQVEPFADPTPDPTPEEPPASGKVPVVPTWTIIGQSWPSFWIKIVSSWVVYLLYGWTLVAPIILEDRSFSC